MLILLSLTYDDKPPNVSVSSIHPSALFSPPRSIFFTPNTQSTQRHPTLPPGPAHQPPTHPPPTTTTTTYHPVLPTPTTLTNLTVLLCHPSPHHRFHPSSPLKLPIPRIHPSHASPTTAISISTTTEHHLSPHPHHGNLRFQVVSSSLPSRCSLSSPRQGSRTASFFSLPNSPPAESRTSAVSQLQLALEVLSFLTQFFA